VEKKLALFIVCQFLANFFPQLNIKTVHNLRTKSSGIILTPWAMFVPISAFLLFLVSEIERRRMCLFLAYFLFLFLQILPQLKKLFRKIYMHASSSY